MIQGGHTIILEHTNVTLELEAYTPISACLNANRGKLKQIHSTVDNFFFFQLLQNSK